MQNKKWRFRGDMLSHYINGVSNRTFQDAENRLNYLESKEQMPDMRLKVEEYIVELDEEIDRCISWDEKHMDCEACKVIAMEARLETLNEVKHDLKRRLNELV